MYPLWEVAIAPVIGAAQAKRIVEIGALRGENTVQILESLAPGSEVHVIDPAPEFDPTEHERAFPGRYVFHRGLSLDVLPNLAPMDAALVDGDHNWYTVYHELKLLAEVARNEGQPLPVLVLHDVGWPYGRRDLYYAPETIPEEFRQPYDQAGMGLNSKKLLRSGGLNPTMYNAKVEGGPRNGVMTALEDFIAEHDRPVRMVYLPIYYGLAVVVDEDRLAHTPELVDALDRLESSDVRHDLLEVTERVRLRAMMLQHNFFFQRSAETERATGRYLEVVKSSLLDEHYLDHEVRMRYLTDCLLDGRTPDPQVLRDPVRHAQATYNLLERRRLGPAGPDATAATSFLPYAAMGRPRLDHLHACLDAIRADGVAGDLLEVGTGRGGAAIFMRAYLDAYEVDESSVWVSDRFRSTPEPDTQPSLPNVGVSGFRADLNLVRDGFARFGLLDDRVHFLEGTIAATLGDAPLDEVALVRIGTSVGGAVRAVLDLVYDRLSPGGFVIVEGATASGLEQVAAFRNARGIVSVLDQVDPTTVAWRKGADEETEQHRPEPVIGAPRAPTAPALGQDTIDLSVVVVFYNMRREAQRTLASLSRPYQEGLEDVTYEVIVVENGSDPEERLGEDLVSSFGPEFRYLDLGSEAPPSPAPALNLAIRRSRGRHLALMIDGAHVLTPGVLRFGLAGLATYEPAIVTTQQWYVGPGQQSDAMEHGYDRDYEDRLFEGIAWPRSGYRLFEIGHFIGDRDWLDGVWESNCMFVSRAQLEQVGGFDESFSMPGGGYTNLELYERLGTSPGITVVSILGEGSFHQLHGGDTTNQPDASERRSRIFGYSRHYAELRGRPFVGPRKPIHYVGRFTSPAARRTRARQAPTGAFADAAGAVAGLPTHPTPVPDELERAFTEAVWRSLPWEATTWLGSPVDTPPTDLLAYQEILAEVRPDWILEIGGGGGRSAFLASICELLGHGQVLAVGASDESVEHPRIRHLAATATDAATIDEVHSIVGDDRAVVVLGARAATPTTVLQFESYSDLVPVGSYVIVTDTVVNGRPVWPEFGPGPGEAVKQILQRHGEFVADPSKVKYSLTFNPMGFLQRVE